MTDRLLVELLALREQLMVAAMSPGVDAARRLTAEVMPVLEPVWSVLVDEDNGSASCAGWKRTTSTP